MDLEPGYTPDGALAVRPGPAPPPACPLAVRFAAFDPSYLLGLLAAISLQDACVDVAYAPTALGGLHAGRVRMRTAEAVGALAANCKGRGLRTRLMPATQDEVWIARFVAEAPTPFVLEAAELPQTPDYFVHSYPVWRGPAFRPDARDALKLCFATTDRDRLVQVLAGLRRHPACETVKYNPKPFGGRVSLGRAFFSDADTTGRLWRFVRDTHPELHPIVQDDGWFSTFRLRTVRPPG